MRPISVLYVEDCIELQDAITDLLRDGGDEVVCCASAEAAQALLAQRAFDVLLIDVKLDGAISGTELTRDVLARTPLQRVILRSGGAMDDRALGANTRILHKPFEVRELESLLAQARG